jgi:uncharacterized membrane protein YkoI
LSARISDRVRRGIAVALIALGGAAFLPPAFAHDDPPVSTSANELDRRPGEDDQDYARRLFGDGHIVSLESIVQQARTIRPGELLKVELERKRGRHIYEVEILDETGQAWELKFDARDGRLLKEEMEDH